MTDEKCKTLIDSFGINRNPMSGIEGEFYTSDRKNNLLQLCQEIIEEKT